MSLPDSNSGDLEAQDDDMRRKIIVPDLGEVHTPAKFGGWLVEQGDSVHLGERVAEVVAEGVLVEIRAHADGFCCQEWISTGAVVHPLQVLGEIATSPDHGNGAPAVSS